MALQTNELARVAREQIDLYDRMARSVWGDRLLMGMTAAMMGGMGLGLLLAGRWPARMTGAMLYATAAAMELYAAMMPKHRAEREEMRRAEEAGEAGGRPEARAA